MKETQEFKVNRMKSWKFHRLYSYFLQESSNKPCYSSLAYCKKTWIVKLLRTLRLLRKLAKTLDSSDRILSLKDVTTRDEDISTSCNQTRSRIGLYATIYLDKSF